MLHSTCICSRSWLGPRRRRRAFFFAAERRCRDVSTTLPTFTLARDSRRVLLAAFSAPSPTFALHSKCHLAAAYPRLLFSPADQPTAFCPDVLTCTPAGQSASAPTFSAFFLHSLPSSLPSQRVNREVGSAEKFWLTQALSYLGGPEAPKGSSLGRTYQVSRPRFNVDLTVYLHRHGLVAVVVLVAQYSCCCLAGWALGAPHLHARNRSAPSGLRPPAYAWQLSNTRLLLLVFSSAPSLRPMTPYLLLCTLAASVACLGVSDVHSFQSHPASILPCQPQRCLNECIS